MGDRSGLARAVDALSLSIDKGQTFALVGESGCGKSMTALSIMRLLPDAGEIVSGRVLLDGVDLMREPEAAMRDIRGRRVEARVVAEPFYSRRRASTSRESAGAEHVSE